MFVFFFVTVFLFTLCILAFPQNQEDTKWEAKAEGQEGGFLIPHTLPCPITQEQIPGGGGQGKHNCPSPGRMHIATHMYTDKIPSFSGVGPL